MTSGSELRLYPRLTVGFVYAKHPTVALVCRALEAIEAVLQGIEMVSHLEKSADGTIVERRLTDRRHWIEQACSLKTPDIIGGLPHDDSNISVTTVYHAPYHGHARGALLLSVSKYWNATNLDRLIIDIGDRTQALHCEAMDLNSLPILKEAGRFRAADGQLVNHYDYQIGEYPHLRLLLSRIDAEKRLDLTFRIHPNLRISWLNYWSANLSAEMGFDTQRLKQGGFYDLQKTEQGWYLRLTEEPLDIRRPEHAEILLRAYELLPVGRSTG